MTAAASAADAGIHKKILGLSYRHSSPSTSYNNTITLIISNNEMEEIIKIVKSLEYSGLLFKGVTETIQNEVKTQKGRFLSILSDRFGASLLGNILADKGTLVTIHGRRIIRAGEGTTKSTRKVQGIVKAGYDSRTLNSSDF